MNDDLWAQIERAALHDPTLHMAVTWIRCGMATREDALARAALMLSEQRTKLLTDLTERLKREPADPRRYFVNDNEVTAEQQGEHFRKGIAPYLRDSRAD